MKSNVVSIIIPIYNHGFFLIDSIKSILAQSYKNWEIIIVNDGSDEPFTLYLLNELAKSNIKIFHQEHKGPSAARNLGISYAKGDYILCLDADDILHPLFLENTVKILNNNSDIGVVVTWTKYFGEKNGIFRTKSVDIFYLLQRNHYPVTCLFRKYIWEKVGGFDERMIIGAEDWEFWIRVSISKYKFYCIQQPLFYYRIHKSSRDIIATKKRVFTISYVKKKYPQVYLTSLYKLINHPMYRNISLSSLVKFWLSNLFYIKCPNIIKKAIFLIYATIVDNT